MARHKPNLVLMAFSILAWLLWMYHVYPFSEEFFNHKGYGMHVSGGIGYAALQVSCMYLFFPEAKLSWRSFWFHGLFAAMILGVVELLQYFDQSRHVQLEDMIAQTAGIALSLSLLKLTEKKNS